VTLDILDVFLDIRKPSGKPVSLRPEIRQLLLGC
jgi:hypothetical protein